MEASPQRMAEAARNFLAALSPQQLTAAEFPFDADAERTRWSNLPASMVERSGARLGDLGDEQRRRLHELLRASTSSQGYQKIAGVIRLDEVLHEEASAAVASGERRLPRGSTALPSSSNTSWRKASEGTRRTMCTVSYVTPATTTARTGSASTTRSTTSGGSPLP